MNFDIKFHNQETNLEKIKIGSSFITSPISCLQIPSCMFSGHFW